MLEEDFDLGASHLTEADSLSASFDEDSDLTASLEDAMLAPTLADSPPPSLMQGLPGGANAQGLREHWLHASADQDAFVDRSE